MMNKICNWGAYPIIAIFTIFFVIPFRDWLVASLGEGATNLILFLFVIYAFYIIITQFFKAFARFAMGIFILFITLITLIIGYSTLPEQKYNRALEKSQLLKYEADRSHYKNDGDYSDAVEHANNEEKARQLELQVAELRNYPSYHLFGIKPWMKISFLSVIGLMLAYGICWLIVGNKEFEKEAKQKPNAYS